MAIAPAGHRTWAVGEVVTQTLQQTFLQDQVVNVMTLTERDALTVDAGSAGATVFNTTDSTLDIYTGSAWVVYATSSGASDTTTDGGDSASWVRQLVSAQGGTSTG